MIIYRQCPIEPMTGTVYTVMRFNEDNSTSGIQFNLSNMDYQNFKTQIYNETAQLEDVNGVLMTPEEAKAYVATLP